MSSIFAPVNNIRGISRKEGSILVRQSDGSRANAGIIGLQRSRNGRPNIAASTILRGGIRCCGHWACHFLDRCKIVKISVTWPSHEVSSGLPSLLPSDPLSLGECDRLRSTGLDLATGGDVDGEEAGPS